MNRQIVNDLVIPNISKLTHGLYSRILIAGSYRRGKQDIGDLDLVTIDGKLVDIKEVLNEIYIFKGMNVIRSGRTYLTVKIPYNNELFQVEFLDVPEFSIGSAMLHSTGSSSFNIGMRTYAKQKGFKLSQYGLYKREEWIAGNTEEQVFNKLGLTLIPPQERENFWNIKDHYKLAT